MKHKWKDTSEILHQRSPEVPTSSKISLEFARTNYSLRILGMALATIAVGGALFQNHARNWEYLLLIGTGVGWPQLAFARAFRSREPVVREKLNLKIDFMICGLWLPIIGFNLAPSILMITILSMQNSLVGGSRLLIRGLAALLIGVIFSFLFFRAQFNPLSDQVTRISCAPFLLFYPTALGIVVGSRWNRNARNKARERQYFAEDRFSQLLAASSTVLCVLQYEGSTWKVVEITSNVELQTGYSNQEILQTGRWDYGVNADDSKLLSVSIDRAAKGESVVCHYRVIDKSGSLRWIQDQLSPLPITPGQPLRIMGARTDITETREAQALVRRLAFFDTLTGLANRQSLQKNLSNYLSRANHSESGGWLLILDINDFTSVNNIYGYSVGDQVLVEIAKRIRSALPVSGDIARLESDKFAILVSAAARKEQKLPSEVFSLAKDLLELVAREIIVKNVTLNLSASIGVSIFPKHGDTAIDIIRNADIALNSAKLKSQKPFSAREFSNIVIFEKKMHEDAIKRYRFLNELRAALADNRFELWLQNQVDRNESIIGAEALIRVRLVNGQVVSPDSFIDISEQTGLIIPIGRWTRAEAYRLLARTDKVCLPRLSINVSAIEFVQPEFIVEISSMLAEKLFDPRRLILEVTESLFVNQSKAMIDMLNHITSAGIKISVDDFGTGYSNLAYLQKLPIDEIKIEESFVRDIIACDSSARLVRSLINLARDLEINVIAEGVETREQAAFLIQHGCHFMQGYIFGRPEAVAEYFKNKKPNVVE